MKEIEIYKENDLVMSTLATDYDISTYGNSVDVVTKIGDIEITYSIPVNKGYKVSVKI